MCSLCANTQIGSAQNRPWLSSIWRNLTARHIIHSFVWSVALCGRRKLWICRHGSWRVTVFSRFDGNAYQCVLQSVTIPHTHTLCLELFSFATESNSLFRWSILYNFGKVFILSKNTKKNTKETVYRNDCIEWGVDKGANHDWPF